jgi:hypothetical protein
MAKSAVTFYPSENELQFISTELAIQSNSRESE